MTLSTEHREYIHRSVLCWLASVSDDGVPNVSPKEIFSDYGADEIIVANIASPQTIKNIEANAAVCVSFIDILVQKGFQLKGEARLVNKGDVEFSQMEKPLLKMTEGKFPFASIIAIKVGSSKPIIAPRYIFYPDTSEESQIDNAKKAYGLE